MLGAQNVARITTLLMPQQREAGTRKPNDNHWLHKEGTAERKAISQPSSAWQKKEVTYYNTLLSILNAISRLRIEHL